MPTRAFVPVPLVDAQPRVYKSFRGRQLKGIAFGVAGAAVGLLLMRTHDFAGYLLAFLMALPGFAYGYYQPDGRPLEYWLRVVVRYYTKPQIISASPLVLRLVWLAQFDPIINAVWHNRRRKQYRKRERGARG
ncbi:MAG TPA: PrgI family protein [Symbiobacteriaceae bacterium]|nr:PrgI family protein [Symbiobacteriaceae bacterium]